jgi:hypothetical protein
MKMRGPSYKILLQCTVHIIEEECKGVIYTVAEKLESRKYGLPLILH